MAVVAFVALGSAAFARPSQVWVEVMVTMAVALLLAGSVTAVVGAGRTRIFAAGFAIVGWLYFLLTFGNFADVKQNLLTTRSIAWANSWRETSTSAELLKLYAVDSTATSNTPVVLSDFAFPVQSVALARANLLVNGITNVQPELLSIGHSLWTILLAVLGGVFAKGVYNMSQGSNRPPT
jgi:hypothetical protein